MACTSYRQEKEEEDRLSAMKLLEACPLPHTSLVRPNFVCTRCKEGFHNLGSLALHMETHEVPFTKTMAGRVSPSDILVGVCSECKCQLPCYPGAVWPQTCETCRVRATCSAIRTSAGKKVAYISGKYTDDSLNGIYENIQRARAVALKYWRLGYAVICPHTNTAFMDGDPSDYEMFMSGDLELVRRSDVVVMLPGWVDSPGALRELNEARRVGKEVVYETPS